MSSRSVCSRACVGGKNSSRSPSPPRSGLALASRVVGIDVAISQREKCSNASFLSVAISNKKIIQS
jgi:hypothetical protein